jgi:hypothetical protein
MEGASIQNYFSPHKEIYHIICITSLAPIIELLAITPHFVYLAFPIKQNNKIIL